jgi:hypothetical protein
MWNHSGPVVSIIKHMVSYYHHDHDQVLDHSSWCYGCDHHQSMLMDDHHCPSRIGKAVDTGGSHLVSSCVLLHYPYDCLMDGEYYNHKAGIKRTRTVHDMILFT